MMAARLKVTTALMSGLLAGTAVAQVVVVPDATGRFRYVQDFDKLPATGMSSRWIDNRTLPGWFLFNGVEQPLVTPTLRIDDGQLGSGAFYSYGRAGSTDRALGAVGTGAFYFGTPAPGGQAGYAALALRHGGSVEITRLKIAFQGQQWRQAQSDDVNTIVFEFGIGERLGDVQSWVRPGRGFDFDSPSPELGSVSGVPLDGHSPAASRSLGGMLSTTGWLPGQTLWLRWSFLNNFGYDHGLAIDQLSLNLGD
ncbi:hypothetical protein VVD49_13535 [Uliginosibacterium sp. H3]|uniref:Cellulose biosynthesis protein BcsS n=1 Tax=Uliginosibacterium silvisoli TaxID=3114758 RepID=A0ABU6K597_9RHOO|nr:hypothetical protein [Uliginosibacterium sp. H3]